MLNLTWTRVHNLYDNNHRLHVDLFEDFKFHNTSVTMLEFKISLKKLNAFLNHAEDTTTIQFSCVDDNASHLCVQWVDEELPGCAVVLKYFCFYVCQCLYPVCPTIPIVKIIHNWLVTLETRCRLCIGPWAYVEYIEFADRRVCCYRDHIECR